MTNPSQDLPETPACCRHKKPDCRKATAFLAIMRSSVVARRAQHRVQPVAALTLEVTASHAMVGLEVVDERLDRLAPLELAALLLADAP
jgi:hypothetical protein